MRRALFILLAFVFVVSLLCGCRGVRSKPARSTETYAIEYVDQHSNAFKGLTPQGLAGMKVGLIHARYHYVKPAEVKPKVKKQDKDKDKVKGSDKEKDEALKQEARIKGFIARFKGGIIRALRQEAVFQVPEGKLDAVPVVYPVRVGRAKGGKYLMLNLQDADARKVAAFIEANGLDAALTVDGSTEYIMFNKQYIMVMRLDCVLYDRSGAELYNVTTYVSAPARGTAFTSHVSGTLSQLAGKGVGQFSGSLRELAAGKGGGTP